MSFLYRFTCTFVIVLVISSFFYIKVQAGLLNSVTEMVSSSPESTTYLVPITEEVSDVVNVVNDVSPLIDTTTSIVKDVTETVLEEVDRVVTETVLTPVDEHVNSIVNLTSKLTNTTLVNEVIQQHFTQSGDRTIYQPEKKMDKPMILPKDENSSSEQNPLSKNLTEKSPEDLKKPEVELETATSLKCCHTHTSISKEISIHNQGIKTTMKKAKTPKEPEPINVPVPIGIMTPYTVISLQSKTCSKKNGFRYPIGTDAIITDSIQIRIANQKRPVNHKKLIVSNRANEPPGQPPKHRLFSSFK